MKMQHIDNKLVKTLATLLIISYYSCNRNIQKTYLVQSECNNQFFIIITEKKNFNENLDNLFTYQENYVKEVYTTISRIDDSTQRVDLNIEFIPSKYGSDVYFYAERKERLTKEGYSSYFCYKDTTGHFSNQTGLKYWEVNLKKIDFIFRDTTIINPVFINYNGVQYTFYFNSDSVAIIDFNKSGLIDTSNCKH